MWRFHKDMREKDQAAGNSNLNSGIKGENVVETNSQTNEVVDSIPLSEIKSNNSLSAASLPSGSGSKASSPKSEIVIDPPIFGDAIPAEALTSNNKALDSEKALVNE